MAKFSLIYYALGGGLGHLTRALAIINTLDRNYSNRYHFTLLTNSPHASQLDITPFAQQLKLITIDSQAELIPRISQVLQVPAQLLVVDTFPRGLMGELPLFLQQLSCPKLLIQRFLKPDYLKKFDIAKFVTTNYQACLRLADNLPLQQLHPNTYDLAPVTLTIDRCQTIEDIFNHNSPRPRLLFLDFGTTADSYIQAIPDDFQIAIVTINPTRAALLPNARECYPASLLFAQADLIVGGCGYNLFHELQRAQRAAIFLPQLQTYDDQFGRAHGYRQARSINEFQQQLRDWYNNWQSGNKPAMLAEIDRINGAQQAAEIINCYL